jgi:hypothetical protein
MLCYNLPSLLFRSLVTDAKSADFLVNLMDLHKAVRVTHLLSDRDLKTRLPETEF